MNSLARPIEPAARPVERYRLGVVRRSDPVAPGALGLTGHLSPRAIYEVSVSDPYVDACSQADVAAVAVAERDADEASRRRREAGAWERPPGTIYLDEDNAPRCKPGWGDPVSRRAFFRETLSSPAVNAWLTKVPSAAALLDLSDPVSEATIVDRKGRTFAITDTDRKWLTLCTDAVAIRARAAVMAALVTEAINRPPSATPHPGHDDGPRWMSIASGTTLPMMKAAERAGARPDLTLVDLDKNALAATRRVAATIGFHGAITHRANTNIFVPDEMSRLRDELSAANRRPMLIDLMGIFEYVGDNLGVDPARFLRAAYDMLLPGGRLLFGQMRDDRPVADFTTGVVSWPYIELRSPREVMHITRQAEIPTAATTLYLPDDGVYTIATIDKPGVKR